MADKEKGKYVPIYLDWLDVTQDLSPEEKGNLIDAVVSYAAGKDFESFLSGGVRIAFRFMKGQVDRNKEISEKRSKAASGGSNESKPEQDETNGNKPQQTATKLPKEKEKEEDKEKEKENKKDDVKQKRFTPPTVEEVDAYCKERNNGINAQHFVDYYQQGNWVLKNGRKMTDWKAAVRTWEGNGYHNNKPAPEKTVPAQQYSQRDYSGEDEEAFRQMLSLVGG